MSKRPIDILKDCNYLIEYKFNPNSQGIVRVLWDDSELYQIKWNSEYKSICTNWKDQVIPCETYVAPIIARLVLLDILNFYGYPIQWVQFYYCDNLTTKFFFNPDGVEESESTLLLDYLVTDMISQGLWPSMIEAAKECGIWSGFKDVVNFYMGIKINDSDSA